MKKFLSLVLTAVIMLSTFSCLTLTASATDDVDSISFEPAESVRVVLYEDCVEGYCEKYPDCDCDSMFSKYVYNSQVFTQGSVLTVNFTDGSYADYVYDEISMAFISESGDCIYEENIDITDDQATNHWYDEGEYSFSITYGGCSTIVPITVDSIDSVSFILAEPVTLSEGIDGEDNGEYFEYELYIEKLCENGNTFRVNYSSGAYDEYIYNEDEDEFCNKGGNYLDIWNDWRIYSDQSGEWSAGAHSFILEYRDIYTTNVSVTIAENPVKSISYTPVKAIELIENYDGYWNEWDETFFEYQFPQKTGDIFTVNFTDGTKKEYICTNDYYEFEYISSDGEAIREELSIKSNQSSSNQWTSGNSYEFTVSYSGRTASVPVSVIDTPVKNISYTLREPIELTEKVDGTWREEVEWDDDTGSYISTPFFDYDVSQWTIPEKVECIKVEYKDGSIEEYYSYENETEFLTNDGQSLNWRCTIDSQSWKVGSDNYIVLSILGFNKNIPVTIVKNPVESISYTPVSPLQLRENVDGSFDYGWNEDEDYVGYFTYDFEYRTGDVVTVNYADGTSEEYVCKVIDNGIDEKSTLFLNEDDEELPRFNEHNIAYVTDNQTISNCWEIGKKYEFVFNYMGRTATIPVEIVESPVKAISFTPVEPIELVQWVDGWDEDALGYFPYFCKYDRVGDKITVTFKDGTTKDYICKAENGKPVFVSADGEYLETEYLGSGTDQLQNPWEELGEYSFELFYMGAKTDVPVEIVANNVESVDVSLANPLAFDYNPDDEWYNIDYVGDILNKEGNKIILNFKDGSKKEYSWNQDAYDTYLEGWCDSAGNRFNHYIYTWQEDGWTLEQQNYLYVKFMGKIAKLPVTLVAGCSHNWTTEGCGKTEPTCTETGSQSQICEECGAVGPEITIPALGHNYSTEWTIDKAATCTENGSKSHHCTRCDSKKDITAIIAEHKPSEWIVDKEASTAANGSKHKECTVCGETMVTEVIPRYSIDTPKLKSASRTASGVKIVWEEVLDIDFYIVYRKTSKSGWTRLGTTTEPTFTDTKAKTGTTYYYTVKAQSGEYTGGFNKTGLKIKFVAAPKLTKIANESSGVRVYWSKVSGADGYYLYRRVAGSKTWTKVATIKKGSTTSYLDKKASAGKTYEYIIKCYDGSTPSAAAAKVIKIKRLTVPKLVSAKSSKTGITVKWGKVAGAEGYLVYRKTGKGSWVQLTKVEGNAKVSFVDKSAKKGKTYTYTVRAYSGSYKSSYNSKGLTVKDKY